MQLAGFDLGYAENDRGEAALDDVRVFVLFKREGHVGGFFVDQGLLVDQAKVGIGIFGTSFFGNVAERFRTVAQGFQCRLGCGLVLERDLLDAALLRHVVAVFGCRIGRRDFLVGHRHLFFEVVDRQRQKLELAEFRRHETRFRRLIAFFQFGVIGLGDGDGFVGINSNPFEDALFLIVGVRQFKRRLRNGHALHQRAQHLGAHFVFAEEIQEALLRQSHLA